MTERIAVNAHLNRFPRYAEYYNEYIDRILRARKSNIHDLRDVLQAGDLIFSHKDIIHVNASGNSLISAEIYRCLAEDVGTMVGVAGNQNKSEGGDL